MNGSHNLTSVRISRTRNGLTGRRHMSPRPRRATRKSCHVSAMTVWRYLVRRTFGSAQKRPRPPRSRASAISRRVCALPMRLPFTALPRSATGHGTRRAVGAFPGGAARFHFDPALELREGLPAVKRQFGYDTQ